MMIDIAELSNTFYKIAASPYWNKWYSKNKEHFKELVNHHKRKRRKELQVVIDEKKNKPCKKCHGTFPPAAMDLVHRDPDQKNFSLRDATRLIHSIDKLKEELAKCDVICANCVKETHMKEFLKETGEEGSRNRRRKKLKALVDEMKTNACSDCGNTYSPYVLEFDHLGEEEKVDSIAKMINKERPLKMIMEEINKTEPICTNCHRVRTYNRSHDDDDDQEE